jgi:hypothetical protein
VKAARGDHDVVPLRRPVGHQILTLDPKSVPRGRAADDAAGRRQHQPGGKRRACTAVLSITALEQVLCSSLETLGAEQFEAECVGEPAGRIEGGADRQRVLDLLG